MIYSATIDATGISAPAYSDILDDAKAQWNIIVPGDQTTNDSMVGQMLALWALSVTDSNNAAIHLYNNFSPNSAVGASLSNQVKINGLIRQIPTQSTCPVTIIGQTGTTITNGAVSDINGIQWNLPASVLIDVTGQVTALATCANEGAVAIGIGQITQIATPTLGWQSVYNNSASSTGNSVETDQELRIRQSLSVANPSQAIADGILAGVSNVPGVIKAKVYNNNTDYLDEFGIPGHNLAVVALGGDPVAIATAIAMRKVPGSPTYGNVLENVTLVSGVVPIYFWYAQPFPITAILAIKPKPGYTDAIGFAAMTNLAEFVGNLGIGEDVLVNESGGSVLNGQYFHIVGLSYNGGISGQDVFVPFQSYAVLNVGDITLELL